MHQESIDTNIAEEAKNYISVDVETAGPNPGRYALLSIGACPVRDPDHGFYVELKPTSMDATPEALSVSGLSLKNLLETGLEPAEAMARFATWLEEVLPSGVQPIFVAFNAPFDWMFVNDYFHRYLGRNPFGHTALDMKAFYMGLSGSRWNKTALRHVNKHYALERTLTHHALQDAQDQATLFQEMLRERGM
jgi:DNA polymerase III epsilon subunit-like protein